jgi:hypothetical protein
LQELVLGALQVDSRESYEAWRTKAKTARDTTREQLQQWQQFIVHAVDERGDPISDYQIELYSIEDDTQLDVQLDPDIYKYDSSYRSYHVDVQDLVGMTVRHS